MSDNPDFRVECSVFDHPKWMRLESALGDKGTMALIRLWGWARRHRNLGDLTGMTDAEISAAARWKGAGAKLVAALVDIGWIDGQEGRRSLHDWLEHQPHAANTTGFRRAQKIKALERWARDARQPVEVYVRHHYGVDLETYLGSSSRPKRNASGIAGHMPGMMPGNAESMPPPSHPPTHPPTHTQHGHAGAVPGSDPDGSDRPPERGYATTDTSPAPNPSEPSGPGRSRRRQPGVPDAPAAPADHAPPSTASGDLEPAQLAHHLELRIVCGYAQADKAVRGLLDAGADPAWILARIMATQGTPAPWQWAKEARAALQPAPATPAAASFFAPVEPS